MKTAYKMILIGSLMAVAGVGCSSNSSNSEMPIDQNPIVVTPDAPSAPPDNTGTDTSSSVGTNSVAFTPVSLAEMNTYVATHPLNAPTNFKVTVDLQADAADNAGPRYYGQIKISYVDNGQTYEGVFDSGSGTNSKLPYSPNNGMKEYYYNHWFKNPANNLTSFSGYFQDPYGAVVLVIDNAAGSIDLGDGQGSQTVLSGSIWYKNFPYSYAPQGPERKCWYITVGPYQCGSSTVTSKSALNPSGYRKLGTFTGLNLSTSFKSYQ